MKEIFNISSLGVVILMNTHGRLFWKSANNEIDSLANIPEKYQIPFLIKFIQRYDLAERFKDLETTAAIDIYIKSQFTKGDDLELNVT